MLLAVMARNSVHMPGQAAHALICGAPGGPHQIAVLTLWVIMCNPLDAVPTAYMPVRDHAFS